MCDSVDISLGQLTLESVAAGLELQLTSSARFGSISCHDHSAPIVNAAAAYESCDTHVYPWVLLGPKHRLELSLKIDLHLTAEQQDKLLNTLSGRMMAAECWKQLGLAPTSVETSVADEEDTRLISVFLGNAYETPAKTTRIDPRLGRDIPLQDIKPPPGVPRAVLDAVFVHMRLWSSRHEQRQLKNRPVRGRDHFTNSASDSHTATIDSDSEMLELGVGTGLNSCAAACDVTRPAMAESDQGAAHASVLQSLAPPTVHLVDDVSDLVSIAFKHVCCKYPARTPESKLMKEDAILRRLSNIAPSVWSPEYVCGMAGRAVFLPTISHCMARVESLSRHSNREPASNRGTAGCCHDGGSEDTEAALSNHLWAKMHSRLHDPAAARRLKPIMPVSDGQATSPNSTHEILDVQQDLQSSLTRQYLRREDDLMVYDLSGDEDLLMDAVLSADDFDFTDIESFDDDNSDNDLLMDNGAYHDDHDDIWANDCSQLDNRSTSSAVDAESISATEDDMLSISESIESMLHIDEGMYTNDCINSPMGLSKPPHPQHHDGMLRGSPGVVQQAGR